MTASGRTDHGEHPALGGPEVVYLKINVDGTMDVDQFEPTLDNIKAAIGGGWIEMVSCGAWHMYVDEEGRLKHMPYNAIASELAGFARNLPIDLHGPAVCFGNLPMDGEEKSIPEYVIKMAGTVRRRLTGA